MVNKLNSKFEILEIFDYRNIQCHDKEGSGLVFCTSDDLSVFDTFFYQTNLRVIYLKKFFSNSRLEGLVELTAADKLSASGSSPTNPVRFKVFIILLSLSIVGFYFFFQFTLLKKKFNQIFSLRNLYAGSAWLERECWDMFGIIFIGNNDLRRILTDYGFTGFPLRKDFPVVGFSETRYDEELTHLCSDKISLAQELRLYSLQSPL
jgi:NADH:ubiquinone oxidoreductase subunit C